MFKGNIQGLEMGRTYAWVVYVPSLNIEDTHVTMNLRKLKAIVGQDETLRKPHAALGLAVLAIPLLRPLNHSRFHCFLPHLLLNAGPVKPHVTRIAVRHFNSPYPIAPTVPLTRTGALQPFRISFQLLSFPLHSGGRACRSACRGRRRGKKGARVGGAGRNSRRRRRRNAVDRPPSTAPSTTPPTTIPAVAGPVSVSSDSPVSKEDSIGGDRGTKLLGERVGVAVEGVEGVVVEAVAVEGMVVVGTTLTGTTSATTRGQRGSRPCSTHGPPPEDSKKYARHQAP